MAGALHIARPGDLDLGDGSPECGAESGYLQNNVLTELDVDLKRVLDITDPAVIGLVLADLTGPDLASCQELAKFARNRGVEALLVPSAALPGSNLVILPENLTRPLPIRVVQSTELPFDSIREYRPE